MREYRSIRLRWLAASLVAWSLPGCSDGGGPEPGPPTTAAVTVGSNFFHSDRNGTEAPAVDTVAADGTVTWTWGEAGSHSVRSTSVPGFTSGTVQSDAGSTYNVTFTASGTYEYDCEIHGAQMIGRIVVR
ncbi:MAG: cupredoxin domain-containing protein [Gemmatimonadales bacterium]